ncbi:hypothetical protein [Nocardia miyunensis]|uniref:WXG100-like domain-containing protein n=1 Tax=Nocardia miyunensis TaxID=282684 RepID=UPI000836BB5D|nr:hypothetical protein [Nocardia miyunensis]
MTIEIPSYLEPVATLVGCRWPKCDEDALATMGTHWEDMAGTLQKIKDSGDEAATSLARHIDGETHDSFQDYWTGASKHMEQLVELCQGLGRACKIMSVLIKGYKLFAIAAMAELAVNLAIAAATAIETLGASMAEAAGAEAVTRVIIQQAVKKLLMKIIKDTVIEAFKGLAKGLGEELAWEVAEKELGLRDSIDWTKVGEAGAHTAISSAVAGEAKKALKEVGVDEQHKWNPLTSTHKDGHAKDDSTSEHSDGSKSDSHHKDDEKSKKDEGKSDEEKKKDKEAKKKFDDKLGKVGDGVADEAVDGPDSRAKRLLQDVQKLHKNSAANGAQAQQTMNSLDLPPI